MMRALALFLLALAMPAQAQPFNMQWLHCMLVPAYTSVPLDGQPILNAASFALPYTVPEGYVLGITDVQFGSKFTATGRASYLVLNGIMTVPDNHGSVSLRTPIALPAGARVSANYINNDEEAQWMCSVITGRLVPVIAGQRWTQVFGGP